MSDDPRNLASGFFHACLLILAGLIALSLAVDILRCIWPWLAAAAGVAALVYVVVWWLRSRANLW